MARLKVGNFFPTLDFGLFGLCTKMPIMGNAYA